MKQILLTLLIQVSPPRRRCQYPVAGETAAGFWCGAGWAVLIRPWRERGMMDVRMPPRPAAFARLLAGDSSLKGERRNRWRKEDEIQMRRDDKGILYRVISGSLACFYWPFSSLFHSYQQCKICHLNKGHLTIPGLGVLRWHVVFWWNLFFRAAHALLNGLIDLHLTNYEHLLRVFYLITPALMAS